MKKCLAAVMLGLLLPTVSEATVSISTNSVWANVRTYSGTTSTQFVGTSIPTSGHVVDATSGAYYSRTTLDYSTSGTQTTLSNLFDHKRSGAGSHYSQSLDSYMEFTTDTNATYDLAGSYDVTDVSTSGGGWTYLQAYIYDLTDSVYLFNNTQDSRSTVNESFTLGGLGGDHSNSVVGSLSGSLEAAHLYRFYYNVYTYSSTPDAGASANGSLVLDIGRPTGIPEPSTAMLLGLGILGAGVIRWRRRS